jgi:uncharacterized protein YaaQ
MKLIVAIVQDYDTDRVLRGVTSAGYRVTRISSMGGFLRSTNATLFIGVNDSDADRCVQTINQCCRTRQDTVETELEETWLEMGGGEISRDFHGGAVVMVLRVEQFERIIPASD